MRFKIMSTRRALLATTLLGAPMLFSPAPAQDQQEIVVTGSRLIRTDLTAPSPIQVVSDQDVKLAGNVTVDRTMNEMPQLARGNTGNAARGGGSGIFAANLRGLGTNRTLTLVNGRRFIAANSSGDVDMSSIPDALISRVDIISGGASAVYGSDAIAGAINFILKDNFEGVEVTGNYGINSRGDGGQYKFDVTLGGSTKDGRGNLAMSFSYTKVKPFYQTDRSWARIPLAENADASELVYSGSGNITGNRLTVNASNLQRMQASGSLAGPQTSSGTCGSQVGIRFLDDGTPITYCTPEDTFNYAPYNMLQRPLTRLSATAIGHYDLTDHVTAFMETYFVDVKNVSSISPESVTLITPMAGNLAPPFLLSYVNNPAMPDVQARFFAANAWYFDPTGTGFATLTNAGARLTNFGNRISAYERYGFNATGGLRGDLDLGGRNYKWEIFGQYMRSHQISHSYGYINYARMNIAANGCNNNSVVGCVPISIFGYLDPAAKDYVTPRQDDSNTFNRWVTGASLTGSPFDLPAGPVATAIGVEYRRDFYNSQPDALAIAGETTANGNPSLPLAGGFNVKEVFGEIGVPVLADLPFAHRLELNAAIRYSDYSSIGSVIAYKAGLEYAPIGWLRFRGAYNRAIRAPNVGEIYVNPSIGYSNTNDPCAVSQMPTDTGARQARQNFCVSQGIPAGEIATFRQAALGLNQLTLSSAELKAEKSDTYTIGAVISPPFVRNLNLTVDYYNVKVNDAISRPSLNNILADCYSVLDLNSQSCRAILRDGTTGQILYVSTNNQNIGYTKVSGIDGQIDYRFDLPSALEIGGQRAQLSLAALASYVLDKTDKLAVTSPPVDCAGYFGASCSSNIMPNFKLNLNAAYSSGPLSWRLSGRMIGPLNVYPGYRTVVQHISPVWYVDTVVTFDVMKDLRLSFGVNNLLDRQPPITGTTISGDANVDVTLFDVNGRRFFTSATFRF